MATMLAARYHANSADLSTIALETIPVPKASAGSALVRVVTAAVNPIDVYVLKGYLNSVWKSPSPFTLGYDLAGYITELPEGEDSLGFAVGDAVYTVNWGVNRHEEDNLPVGGAFAEFALVPLKKLSKKPESLSFELAAALPLVGTTAIQSLRDCLAITAGSRVLILGGSSAVGLLAIQLAKAQGAWVATTASTRNLDFVKQFGPDQVINYQTEDWGALRGLDAVLDVSGEPGAFKKATNGVLQPNGGYVALSSAEAGHDPLAHHPLRFAAQYCLRNSPADQEALAAAVVAGTLRLPIDETFPFTKEGVVGILKKIEGGKSKGKSVLLVSRP